MPFFLPPEVGRPPGRSKARSSTREGDMNHDEDLALARQLLTRPQKTPPGSLPCNCADSVGITIRVAGDHLATLRSCQWCGDSWDIDGTPASPEAVHALVPQRLAIRGCDARPTSRRPPAHPRRGEPRRGRARARPEPCDTSANRPRQTLSENLGVRAGADLADHANTRDQPLPIGITLWQPLATPVPDPLRGAERCPTSAERTRRECPADA
jgi:hypothetical protein